MAEANAAAKRNLYDSWDETFFVKYKETKERGLFGIEAECPEVEVMIVYVERNDKKLDKKNINDVYCLVQKIYQSEVNLKYEICNTELLGAFHSEKLALQTAVAVLKDLSTKNIVRLKTRNG